MLSNEVDALFETARITNATRLDLSGRGLTELPESVGALTALTNL
jgi:Leucine-rich repeat (LRR) protein